MSHDGEDYTQIAFLRSDIDDSTGEYTERFEAGSFDMPAADALRFDLAVDLMDYFSGRTFEGEPGVSRGLEPREAVAAVEGATGCDLNFFEDFWLGSPGEIVESVHVGPYTKQSLLDFSYYAKELSRRYGFADSDILEIARHLPEECPDRFAAVKAYLDCEYVPDGDAPDEKTYRWGDFLEIAGGDARYAAMLVDRTAAGESEEGLHPERFATGDPDWSWMDLSVASTVELTFADDMALNDWIASETTATGAAWARCFNPYCGPDEKTLNTSEIIDTLRRFESPSYIVRGPIEDIESLPVGYYWCPDALDPDPSYNGYLLNVFAGFDGRGLPGKFFELFGGVTLNDVPSFGFDDGWDGSCLNRLDWFEDAAGMDADGLSAGLVANDAESIKALIGNCPAWIECFPSYSEKAAKGVDDAVQAVKAYRLEGKRVHREVIPGYLYETAKAAAAKTAGGADGGTGPHI